MADSPMGTVEKHVFVAMMLIFSLGGIVILGGILYGIATNLKESLFVGIGFIVFAAIVHLITRHVDWEK